MSLQRRIHAFEILSSRSRFERMSQLILLHEIPIPSLYQLRVSALLYMSRNLPNRCVILDENQLIDEYEKHWKEIKCITPNGMIVPKRHSILEYNVLVRSFAQIIDALGIADLISSWHIPLNVRIKSGEINTANMLRHHPTEHIHSDSWAGESAESVTVHIPLFGDLEKNYVDFYDPPPQFEESWLGPLPSYKDGAEIAKRYRRIGMKVRRGQLAMADFSTLHASTHEPGAKARISIDTTFALKKPSLESKEVIHPWRIEERASHKLLLGLGETHLFVFPDRETDQVDSQGGFKHPTHLMVTPLLPLDPKKRVA